MKIAIGSDHVGIELKPIIIEYLEELGHEVVRQSLGDSRESIRPVTSRFGSYIQ